MSRNILIIDGYYLTKSMSELQRVTDYKRLIELIETRAVKPIHETYFFDTVGNHTSGDGKEKFFNFLRMAKPQGVGFRVEVYDTKYAHTKCNACGRTEPREIQMGVDVGMAVKMIKLAPRYNNLILLSGDSDLKDAIAHVVDDLEKTFHLVGFSSTMSPHLQSYATTCLRLDEELDHITHHNRPNRNGA